MLTNPQKKLDFKKEHRALYCPPQKPVLITPPAMPYIMIDGKGAPDGEAYQEAMQILYALAFTIKMSKMSGVQPKGYFEYVVPPLEGLWWSKTGQFNQTTRDQWLWTSMIRQPDFVTEDVFEWAKTECARKKPEINVSRAILATFEEGLCLQMMHVGAYSEESSTLGILRAYILENNLLDMTGSVRRHHEIYLSDPRRTPPGRLKTVIRLPVDRQGECLAQTPQKPTGNIG